MLGFARRFALILLIPVVAQAGELQSSGPTRLHDVVVVNEQDATTIVLKTSTRPRYHAEFIDTPYRLVVDLHDTTVEWRNTPLDVAGPLLKQVRGSQYRKGLARVVIEFTRKAGYVISEEPDGLAIVIPKTAQTRPSVARPTPPSAPAVAKPVAVPKAPAAVTTVVPTRTASTTVVLPESPVTQPDARAQAPSKPVLPELRVAQAPTVPATPRVPAPSAGGLISLDFKDADVVNLLRILAAESGKNIVIGEDVKGKMSITLRNVPWEQALDIVLEAKGLHRVEKGNVLRIITNEQLARERDVTAKLEEARVRAEEAKGKADAEIRAKQAEAEIKEQESRQKAAAAAAAVAEQQARGPLKEETIRLAYADPEDVAKTLQGLLGIGATGAAEPPPAAPFSGVFGTGAVGAPPPAAPTSELLAKGITIRAHKPTNSVFIRHYEKDLERIKRLIRETLDVQLPQIKIEARLNELNRQDLFAVGVQWGGGGIGRDFRNVLVGQGVNTGSGTNPGIAPAVPSAPFNNPFLTPSAGPQRVPFTLPVSSTTGLPLGGNVVNLPIGNPAGAISFGIIGPRFSLNLALQALESQAKTRSLSRPEIVTVENAKASISLGSEIPYASVSSAGTQVQFKDAVLRLEVTPTVIREPEATKIKMKLVVEDNSRGLDVPSGSSGGTLPTINKRKVETEIVVKEGESLVIGGIAQRTESETISKVPLFGDIPVLGWLFKNRQFTVDPNRELVIFLTPTVLRDAPRATGPTAPPAR